jgi:hypothetical protein
MYDEIERERLRERERERERLTNKIIIRSTEVERCDDWTERQVTGREHTHTTSHYDTQVLPIRESTATQTKKGETRGCNYKTEKSDTRGQF